MSEFQLPAPVSHMPVADDRIRSEKQLVEFASDLQDSEVVQVGQIIFRLTQKYAKKRPTVENLEALRDEALTRLANIGILATVDVAPVLNGEPPSIEILGRISGTEQQVHGFDHERKMYEVKKAVQRGEDWLGQKENPDAAKAKIRDHNRR